MVPLSRYARGPLPYEGLLLGFAAVGTEEIARGVQELAVALEGVQHPAKDTRPRFNR